MPRKKNKLCADCVYCASCLAAHKFGISHRELMIIRLVCDGMSNALIATELFISQETVKRHLSNIFDKTGDDSRISLAMRAVREGWATP